MDSIKCQRCNNITKNPSGLCWLHEGSSSVEWQFSDILMGNPQPLPDEAFDDLYPVLESLNEYVSTR